MFIEDAVLLDQVLDDLLLVPAHPAGHGQEQGAEGVEVGSNAAILRGRKRWPGRGLRLG